MRELYLKTENGSHLLQQDQIDKYNLKIGDISPNNGYHIVDKDGKENAKKENHKQEHTLDEMMSEGIIFTTSEVIDISQGVDSDVVTH